MPGMKAIRTLLLTTCALALIFGMYWVAYQTIGVRFAGPTSNSEPIWFNRKWQARFFSPAARIESFVRQRDVFVVASEK